MRFEFMLPYQIKEEITKNTPVVLPIGVMEYHGEHMAVGMDCLLYTSPSPRDGLLSRMPSSA